MKTIVLFLLCTLPALAQDGFRTEKGKIVWEHTFTENVPNLESLITAQEKMKLVSEEESLYTGKAEAIKSTIDVNSVRLASDANFDFTITKVAGGYKVRVTNYVFLEKYGPMQLRIIPNSLDKYYLEYGKIRNSDKTKTDLGYVDGYLTGLFLSQIVTAQGPALTAK
ncbi:hypothetical protein AM493_09475 [Flavobacterium akiainvivens]|uniref:DUF4468 domain-containing protein n=1 Tax=Flavobacterium akiainvivens TaxID=1202724 RepID=A0A0M8MD08_9FLAO|nr:hypothetical protein [Flavobacterium akiainvivens]KOS06234.1 hypothetical protein AM493_09475 [Flavobacterium akiainvivens]SFQ18258.1 hypothetical protein SAMN05444144_101470 [Flavobacterium akiainvivens]